MVRVESGGEGVVITLTNQVKAKAKPHRIRHCSIKTSSCLSQSHLNTCERHFVRLVHTLLGLCGHRQAGRCDAPRQLLRGFH